MSESIATVHDLEVLSDGSVWVQNSIEPFFIGFGADGELLRVHGRAGGGPDEFGAPSSFVIGGWNGAAWVFDRQRNTFVEVSRLDGTGSVISLPRDELPPGSVMGGVNLLTNLVRTARLGDDVILPQLPDLRESDVFGYWKSIWTSNLVALDMGSRSVREVIALGDVLGDPTPHFDLTDAFLPFPLWFRLWTVCADREIRVLDRFRNEVRGFTSVGTELEPTVLPPPRYDAVTTEQFANATFDMAVVEAMGQVTDNLGVSDEDSVRIMNGLRSRLGAPPEQLANLLPRYLDMRCDENGTLWLRPFDLETGVLEGGPTWLRITADGAIREVRLPDRFDPYRFTSERIWGVQRDELDAASVARIALPETQ